MPGVAVNWLTAVEALREAGAVVELGTCTDEETPAGALAPREPALEQRADSGLATRLAQGRDHHVVDELTRGFLDDCDLEGFLGTEVREQAGLGEAGRLGEPTDREAGDPDDVRELERLCEDRLPGLFSLRHESIIVRSYYSSSPNLIGSAKPASSQGFDADVAAVDARYGGRGDGA